MRAEFYEEISGIFRLKIPFESLYTSVFLIKSPTGLVLVDCATTDYDVNEYIIPALLRLGYGIADISYLVLTHSHGDHAGGLSRISELAPGIKIVTSVCRLFEGIYTYSLAGHTKNCIGVIDERTNTLISGDGIQGAGVGQYRCYTEDPEAYIETLTKIKKDKRIQNILFSHEYEP